MREIHDGRWVRNVGSDGGQTLSWEGRIIVVGACTTAWDQAHKVIASMGDRFVLIGSNSSVGRIAAGTRAIRNTGREAAMRKEMAETVAGLIDNLNPDPRDLSLQDDEEDRILRAADIVTLARTGVETDYRGDVIDAHAPEMPTRFAKQLTQIMRGAMAIGMPRNEALVLALRCARNSVPQLRLAVLLDLKENEDSQRQGNPGRGCKNRGAPSTGRWKRCTPWISLCAARRKRTTLTAAVRAAGRPTFTI